jgi:hypothetical protein
MAEALKYRGSIHAVVAVNPNDIIYPKKITISSSFMFIGWKKWARDAYKNHPRIEYLPIELGILMRYKIISREEHNNIIEMLRSEDTESVYLAHRTIDLLKQKRHGRL